MRIGGGGPAIGADGDTARGPSQPDANHARHRIQQDAGRIALSWSRDPIPTVQAAQSAIHGSSVGNSLGTSQQTQPLLEHVRDCFATSTRTAPREMPCGETYRSNHQRLAAMPALPSRRVDHAPAHSQRRAVIADLKVPELSLRMAIRSQSRGIRSVRIVRAGLTCPLRSPAMVRGPQV